MTKTHLICLFILVSLSVITTTPLAALTPSDESLIVANSQTIQDFNKKRNDAELQKQKWGSDPDYYYQNTNYYYRSNNPYYQNYDPVNSQSSWYQYGDTNYSETPNQGPY